MRTQHSGRFPVIPACRSKTSNKRHVPVFPIAASLLLWHKPRCKCWKRGEKEAAKRRAAVSKPTTRTKLKPTPSDKIQRVKCETTNIEDGQRRVRRSIPCRSMLQRATERVGRYEHIAFFTVTCMDRITGGKAKAGGRSVSPKIPAARIQRGAQFPCASQMSCWRNTTSKQLTPSKVQMLSVETN